jgi:hypothetical protein
MSTIYLYRLNPGSNEREFLGAITESQLDFLIDNLEEEFEEDEDYWIGPSTIEFLRDQGGETELISLLEKAVSGSDEGVEISYQFE